MSKIKWNNDYKNPYFSVDKSDKHFLDEDGNQNHPYYRINNNSSVICYALTPGDKVLMVKQYRPNIDKFTLEFPAGGMYLGKETPSQAAFRELQEETGWSSKLLQIGQEYWTTINRNKSPDFAFVALATRFNSILKTENNIRVCELARSELRHLIKSGSFSQLTALGLIYAASITFGKDLLEIDYVELLNLFNGYQLDSCYYDPAQNNRVDVE